MKWLSIVSIILFMSMSTFVMAQMPLNGSANTPSTNTQAATAPQSQPTKTVQFNDWVLTCRKVEANLPGAQICELVQTVTVNGQKTPFAQFAIGKVQPDQPHQITVVVPINVSFPSSVKVAVDEKDKVPLALAWTRCVPIGCFANAIMKDDLQKKWSALETQGLVIFTAGNGQDIAMPISFKGLKAGLEGLAKEK